MFSVEQILLFSLSRPQNLPSFLSTPKRENDDRAINNESYSQHHTVLIAQSPWE
jgi:hypothetical protein